MGDVEFRHNLKESRASCCYFPHKQRTSNDGETGRYLAASTYYIPQIPVHH